MAFGTLALGKFETSPNFIQFSFLFANFLGKLRLVEDDYLFRIFSQVLGCVDENGWHPREIEKSTVIDTLRALAEPWFVEKIFQWFFEPVLGNSIECHKFTSNFLQIFCV